MNHNTRLCFVLSLSVLTGFVGCYRLDSMNQDAVFEPNLVHSMKYEIKDGVSMDQAGKDALWVVKKMFGSPDEPKLPEVITKDEDLAELISMENLQMAAGPPADGKGLYRQHCANCHGITGNGRGSTAAIITPYPRDYRMGIFKFKTTERGSKPTKADLVHAIKNGIDGTAMKKIPELTDPQIDALADYVIYLSMRGEVERMLVDVAVMEGLIEDGERIIDREFGSTLTDTLRKQLGAEGADPDKVEQLEVFDESWGYAEDEVVAIAEAWLEAEDDVVEVPDPPEGLPVPDSYEEYVKMTTGDQADQLAESVKRGQELFQGKIASCSKCHGKTGKGDGQTDDYDDWTKDWTMRVGLKPTDYDALVPLMARGALPPKNAIPRNFAEGVFRGGDKAEDLYRRITQGIEGSPMPAATFVPGQFEEDDVWDLINFVRSLQAQPAG